MKLKRLTLGGGGALAVGRVQWPASLLELHISDVSMPEASLANMPNLERVSMSNCRLTSLTGIEACKRLEVVDLENNRLVSLPSLAGLPRLEFLYADSNRLTSLPPLGRRLKRLWVKHNRLVKLPSFASSRALREIVVSENKLRSHEWLATVPDRCRVVLVRAGATTVREKRALHGRFPNLRLSF